MGVTDHIATVQRLIRIGLHRLINAHLYANQIALLDARRAQNINIVISRAFPKHLSYAVKEQKRI
jgi:hypothetical protein